VICPYGFNLCPPMASDIEVYGIICYIYILHSEMSPHVFFYFLVDCFYAVEFLNCGKMYTTKFTILTILKCVLHKWISMQPFSSLFHLAKLKLCAH
jgi:hypothetical protein